MVKLYIYRVILVSKGLKDHWDLKGRKERVYGIYIIKYNAS